MAPNNNQVRDIIPPSFRPSEKKEAFVSSPKKQESKKTLKSFPNFKFKFVASAVILYSLILVALSYFARAEVDLILKSEAPEINELLSGSSANSEILTEGAIFEERAELSAKTAGLKNFNERASGTIVIYNAYGSEPQILVANTRFQTPDGKIYRIARAITVPGAKIINGKIEPSSIEVDVFANAAGDEYNIDLADFTIPGFKGSEKFEKFYARSKTPMSGGFIGNAGIVSEKDIESLRQIMDEELKRKLYARLRVEISDDFLVPEGAYKYEAKIESIKPSEGSRADEFKMTMNASLQAIFIQKSALKKKISERFKDDPDFENLDIVNFNELKTEAIEVDFKSRRLKLKISGPAKIVWGVDKGRLASELASAYVSSERSGIFEKYPQIRKARISYRPVWWKIFPDNADKVIINASY